MAAARRQARSRGADRGGDADLRVEGAFALEAQHSAAIILDRVNAHLGWRCVEKIAFRQGPLPPMKEKRRRAGAVRRG